MKSFIFSFFLLAISAFVFAQVPNGNFEEWVENEHGVKNPKHWTTSNFPTPNTLSVHQYTDAPEGSYAMKITSTRPGFEGQGAGYAFVDFSPDALYNLLTAQIRVDSIDTGFIHIYISEWKEVGFHLTTHWQTTALTDGTQLISIPFEQTTMDSIRISIVAGNTETGWGTIGYSEVVIDDIQLHFNTPAQNIKKVHSSFRMYPNPAKETVDIVLPQSIPNYNPVFVEIINLFGQRVLFQPLTNKAVDVSRLPAGIYMVTIQSEHFIVNPQKLLITQ